MIWTGVALLSICRCCWMKTLPAWNCLSGVLMISCDLISIYSDQVLWISSIFSYGLCIHHTRLDIQVHAGGYHSGGHSAMQSHVPWGHLWGDWPPAVADLLCLWHRGPLIPVIRCPSCWDVGMLMFMLTFYSCWLFCLLSACCCLSVECSKVNRIKHCFKSKQAKKNSKRVFSVLLSISCHVNVSIGEKNSMH